MDEEQEPPMPNGLEITSETTRLDVESRPPGGGVGPRVELVLRLAMTECHTWLGIGGRSERVRRPRRMSREIWLALDDNSSSSGGGGEANYLRSGDDCRRLIGRAIKHSLREEEEYRYLTPAYWDEAVPRGVERALAVAVQRGGGATFEAIVDISVHFEFVYCEAKALLRACAENDGGGLAGRSGNGGGGEAPSCCICFEEMSREADEVTDLPGCTHSFHPWCISPWFHKASTCPVCRRDQLQYLPPDYWDLHDSMTIDPDSLPDYL
jgi:hypothetical protein